MQVFGAFDIQLEYPGKGIEHLRGRILSRPCSSRR